MAKYGNFIFLEEDDLDDNFDIDDTHDMPAEEAGGQLPDRDIEVDSILYGEGPERVLEVAPRKSLAGKYGKMGRPPKGTKGKYDKSLDRRQDDYKTDFSKKHTWGWIRRNRWRNAQIAAKKKGVDYLPQDVYTALWEAAGEVKTEWGDVVPAWKLVAKFYDERLRCIMIRLATTKVDGKFNIEDPTKGFVKGNVAIVLVKGKFRNHKVPDAQPDLYKVLSTWEEDGRILDRDGNTYDILT